MNQLVFDFWGTPSKYMAAIKGHQASLLDTAQTRDNVFLTVAQGYFKTLRAKKMVEVAKQNVFDLKEHLRIAQDQYQFGIVTYERRAPGQGLPGRRPAEPDRGRNRFYRHPVGAEQGPDAARDRPHGPEG